MDRLAPGNLAALRRLEEAYLASGDPYRGSGFHGGPDRWREERQPILDAVTGDGDILDVGCANGLLLESLIAWARMRGITLTPHGVDVGPRLVEEARRRLSAFSRNLHIGDIWHWRPPRRFDYVYSVYDCAPGDRLGEYAHLLLKHAVLPGGRLILGAYATPDSPAPRLDEAMREAGLSISGSATVGAPARSTYVWMNSSCAGG